MADVITRFKLETTQFDSKLRDSSKAIRDIAHQAELGGKGFKDFSQKSIEAARSLGQVASGATNTKDKVKDLVGAYNEAAKAYNSLTKEQQQSDFGKALANSIGQLSERIKEAKQELYSLGDAADKVKKGGLFGEGGFTGMMAVAGGNLIASGITKLGSEIADTVQQSIELAKQGEGIRMAFERLNQPGLLNNLKEATHGTVSELELMKQAIKFENFNLPLEDLATYLAFAQQKAKDTGQSVDYLVESIVNGLGRKSLMILDNLGLSATEVKERMKDTGDMTKAVGDIIREQMAKAGDYVETAADRATKADVELKNAMEDLGRTFQPLTDASNGLWNSIKIGALNALNTAVKPLIQTLAEAGMLGQSARSSAGFNNLGGNSKVDRMIGRLGNGKTAGAYSIYQQQLAEFDKYIKNKQFQVDAVGSDKSGVAQSIKTKLQTELDGALKMRAEYVKRAQELHNQVPSPFEPASTSGGGSGGTGGKSTSNLPTYAADSIAAQAALVSELTKKFNESGEAVRNGMLPQLVAAEQLLKAMKDEAALLKANAEGKLLGGDIQTTGLSRNGVTGVDLRLPTLLQGLGKDFEKLPTSQIENMTEALKQQREAFNLAGQAAQGFSAALASIDDPGAKAAGQVVQAIASIALGFAMASSQANTAGTGWGWLAWLAAGASAMATTISTIHSLTGYAEGGMVKGNTYSSDQIPIMANAGEVVLNKSQQATLAQNLQGEGRSINVQGILSGENILIATERTLKRKGRGELVTWK